MQSPTCTRNHSADPRQLGRLRFIFFLFSADLFAQQDFKSATTGVAAKAMRNEINALVSGIDDPAVRKAFDAEMSNFFTLFNRYLSEKAKGEKL